MGNSRFRFSDMFPNSWVYKLKEMGKTRHHNSSANSHSLKKKQEIASSSTISQPFKQNQPHHYCNSSRKSYYFSRELIPPRKSSKQRVIKRRTTLNTSSSSSSSSFSSATKLVSAGCGCRATICTKSLDSLPDYSASSSNNSSPVSDSFPPEFKSDNVMPAGSFDKMISWSNSNDDIIIDVDEKSLNLPPIITKPAKVDEKIEDSKKKEIKKPTKYKKNSHGSLSVKMVKEESVTKKEQKIISSSRKKSLNSPGLKLRVNSPRIGNRKIQGHARRSFSTKSRSISNSLAIEKSSTDPYKDFRESMVDMIVENNISASKELEDLLACYLSLNSDEYHDLIIKVFKQVWFDLTETK